MIRKLSLYSLLMPALLGLSIEAQNAINANDVRRIKEKVSDLEHRVLRVEREIIRAKPKGDVVVRETGSTANNPSESPKDLGIQLPGNVYFIKEGDTLEGIAHHFGVRLRVLKELNRDAKPENLRIGDALFVPNSGPLPDLYRVRKGDTFNQIALSFGLSPELVKELNPDLDPDKLAPGDSILLVRPTPPSVPSELPSSSTNGTNTASRPTLIAPP